MLTTRENSDIFDHIKIKNFCPQNIKEYKKDRSNTDRRYTDNM